MTAQPRPGTPGPRTLGTTEVKRLNRSWRQQAQARVGLLLDSVSQPFNVGSIVRTAAAFGVERIWLCGDTAPPEHPQARRTALGTGRLVTFEREPGSGQAVAAARAAGLRVIAIELARRGSAARGAARRRRMPGTGPRGPGLLPALLAAADVIAYIPQLGRVGSLKVAAAAAIALAETRRREWQRG